MSTEGITVHTHGEGTEMSHVCARIVVYLLVDEYDLCPLLRIPAYSGVEAITMPWARRQNGQPGKKGAAS